MSLIQFQHVNMAYGDNLVLHDFSLRVEEGECLAVIGSSGCGKTTALRLVNGLLLPTSGDVLVKGENTKSANLTQLRRRIGYSIQGNVLFPHLTVEKNIAYVPSLTKGADKRRIKEEVSRWLEIVGLDEGFRRRYPEELSGGQQQRVGLARALAASPEILLMDEPFSAVDEITRRQLQQEFLRIRIQTGITVMFVTHDINEALMLGTRILVMHGGRIQQLGTPEEIRSRPATDFVRQLVSGCDGVSQAR